MDVHIRNQGVFEEFLRALTSDPEEEVAERAFQTADTCAQTPVESAIPIAGPVEVQRNETASTATTDTKALLPSSEKSASEGSIDIGCAPAEPKPGLSSNLKSDASPLTEAPDAVLEPSLRFSMRVNRLELENLDEALAIRALEALRRSDQNLTGLGIRSCAIGERFLSDVLASIERDEISAQRQTYSYVLVIPGSVSLTPHYPLRNLQALDLSTNWMNLVRDPNVGYLLHRVLAALCHLNGSTYRCSLQRLDLSANYLRGFLQVIFGRCTCTRPQASSMSATSGDRQPAASASRIPHFCLPCALHLNHLRLSFCSLNSEDVEFLTGDGDGAGDLLSRVRQLDLSDNNLMMLSNRTTGALFDGTLTHPSGRLAVLELRNVQLTDAQLAIACDGMLKRALARETANSRLVASGGGVEAEGAEQLVECEPSLMFLNLVENVFYSRTLALFLEALALHYPNLTVVRSSYPRDLEVHADVDPDADGELSDDPVIRNLRGKLNFLRKLERTVRQKNQHLSISFV